MTHQTRFWALEAPLAEENTDRGHRGALLGGNLRHHSLLSRTVGRDLRAPVVDGFSVEREKARHLRVRKKKGTCRVQTVQVVTFCGRCTEKVVMRGIFSSSAWLGSRGANFCHGCVLFCSSCITHLQFSTPERLWVSREFHDIAPKPQFLIRGLKVKKYE